MRYLRIAIPVVLCVAGVALVVALRTPPRPDLRGSLDQTQNNGAPSGTAQSTDAGSGKATTSAADNSAAKNTETAGQADKGSSAAQGNKDAAPKSNDPFDYGKTPPVKGDANENVKSVVEAVRNKKNPERLSVLMNPKQFDPEAYRLSPHSYLSIVEPARVHMPKQPAKDVMRISPVGETRAQIKQNESVVLRVKALPKFPVTWTSWDGGKFSNELTSITVEADESGLAETRFFGAPGTIEDVHIVCASPVCSGQVRYTVNITKAE